MNAPKSVEALSGPVSGMDTRPSNANPAATGSLPRIATEAEPSAALTPRFGDIIENGWASLENPTRVGFFVREGRRTGRMNPGRYFEVTDGNGKFWELPADREHKIKALANSAAAIAKAEATATEAQHAGQWVLVPREPTEAMNEAAKPFRKGCGETAERLYRAMIAAASVTPAAPPSPAPPSSEREGSRAGDRS